MGVHMCICVCVCMRVSECICLHVNIYVYVFGGVGDINDILKVILLYFQCHNRDYRYPQKYCV